MPIPETISVWLVEDNEAYRETISDLIDQLDGMECNRRFSSCEAALEELGKSDIPDLIFCDIGLPGMSGIEGVKHFREKIPEVPIVILTIYDGDSLVFDAICAGASGYLLKTSTDKEIQDAIFETLNGGSPINPKIAHKILKMFTKFTPPKNTYDLSDREKSILKMVVDGKTYEAIGLELYISYHTVDYHIRNIYKKLQVHSRTDAVSKALKENLI